MIIPLILCPLKDVHKYIQKHYENQSSKEEFSKNIEFIPYVFLQVKSIKFEKNIITCTLEEDLKTIKIFPKKLRNFLEDIHNKKISSDSKKEYIEKISKELSILSTKRVNIEINENDKKIDFTVKNFQPKIIKKIIFKDNAPIDTQKFFLKFLKKKIGKTYQKKDILEIQEKIKKESFKELFLENNFTLEEKNSNIEISNTNTTKVLFFIRSILNTNSLKKDLKNSYKEKILKKKDILDICKDFYDNKKYFNATFSLEQINIKNNKIYIIDIVENKKFFINNIKFSGYDIIRLEELEQLLKKTASENFSKNYFSNEIDKILNTTNSSLVSGNYYELDFASHFQEKIKHFYHEKGFPFVKVNHTCDQTIIRDCTFFIQERNQYIINNINGISESQLHLLKYFKKNTPIDYLNIENNYSKELENIKKNDYIKVINEDKNLERLTSYIDGNSLDVNFYLKNFKKVVKNEHYIVGDFYTNKKFLHRTICKYFKKNKIVKTKNIEEFQEYLMGTKMFQEVLLEWDSIETENENLLDNLTLKVVENSRKNLSVSLGFTTELGFYLNNSFSINSLGGSNRSLNFDSLFNKRINSYGNENKIKNINFIEYNFSLNYFSDQDINFLEHYLNFNFSKKQLLYFDIKLFDGKYTIIKNITKKFSLGTFYNFSYGDQFNSQNINNNGFIQIGSINIFSTLDLRNNLNYTTKGFFVNASLEHSHTNYFSSKNINFITTDIKTKFYLPLNASFTLSNYINYKYQYNFLDFSIPILRKIKFGSIDDPRGINPKVLNTINSEDITFINLKESHFFNFKTELRYLLTNSLVIGFFVDGGGFTLPSMQYSKGISLKYITPLGSISVDYGSPMRSSFLEGIFTLSLNFF